jgi:hypothetical protein
MRPTRWISVALCLLTAVASASAQGKGAGKPDKQDKAGKPDKAVARGAIKQDKPAAALKQNNSAKATKDLRKDVRKEFREVGGEVVRTNPRSLASSSRKGHQLVGRAISKAHMRGLSDDAFVLTPSGPRTLILNRTGDLLVDIDDDRDIGVWKVVTARETNKEGSPSFCRSGAGHPVWGRQWCVDKGFGLGVDQDVRWARAIDFDNVIFRQDVNDADLTRNVLLDVLGDVVFNRLATHAITLGFVDPLTGRWIGQPTGGPRVLLLSSGARPVAEVVDANRDGRADLLLVATRP